MSINVDKMDPKHNNSLRKSKPVLKRRKKISTASDLSSDSLSPKKRPPNGYDPNDYLSSPEPSFNSSYHNILPNSMNGLSVNSTHGHHHLNGGNYLVGTVNDNSNRNEIVSPNGLNSDSSSQVIVNRHRSDDSDSASTRSVDGASSSGDGNGSVVAGRPPRSREDFYLFCSFILEYENFGEEYSQDALRSTNHSPLDSTGSATESTTSSAVNDESNHASPLVETPPPEVQSLPITTQTPKSPSPIPTTTESNTNDVDRPNVIVMGDVTNMDETKSVEGNIDASSTNEDDEEEDIDADSYNLITCYCGKPYAARPMIECSKCLTWLHMSCAKVKRKHIPDIFICVKCAKITGEQSSMTQQQECDAQQSMPNHPKDLQLNEQPKENNRSKKSTASTSQTRSDKLENNILQPLNVSATAYETGANNINNKQITSTVSSIAVKYK